MRGSGGTEGGLGKFAIGFCLSALATYLFFDSVLVTTAGRGLISGLFGYGRGGCWETTSTGILFVPFFLGVVVLFYDARLWWGWVLTYVGIGALAVEILSRIQFLFQMKTTHLLGMIVLFAAGVGLMLRSYRDDRPSKDQAETKSEPSADN
ncbi:MAG: hypothetical protein ACLP9L_25880 [Thermoguttaceae bacterium]